MYVVSSLSTLFIEQNIRRNRAHYSWLASLGPSAVTGASSLLGAHVYFNPQVGVGGWRMIKYGVISRDRLIADLTAWTDLYTAGRLQKPVRAHNVSPEAASAMTTNRRFALAAALLQLERPDFATRDVLRHVVGLSYLGDVRMGLAEDPRKIDRIVEGSLTELEAIYVPLLKEFAETSDGSEGCSGAAPAVPITLARPHSDSAPWSVDQRSPAFLASLILRLPPPIARSVTGTRDLCVAAAASRTATASIVRSSSLRQAALGLVSANLGKSAAYLWAKVAKRFGT